jgi:hypothetical protein
MTEEDVKTSILCTAISCDRSMFFPGTLVYSTNKTDSHDITEILLKVALNIINQTLMLRT